MSELCDPVRSRQRTYVAMSRLHGRGVFAAGPIAAGDIIEECPMLRFPAAEREHIGATIVDEYYFEWAGDGAIALGFGSLYNHSDTPVAEYVKDTDNDRLIVRAIADIAADEEITFHYSGAASTGAAGAPASVVQPLTTGTSDWQAVPPAPTAGRSTSSGRRAST